MLFGKRPEDSLSHSDITLEAHIGTKEITETIGGPLLDLPSKIEKFLMKNVRTYTEIRKFERVKIPEYPIEALREAVLNAIAHRDYGEGARIIIQLLPSSFVVKSPGLLIQPLSLEEIRTYNIVPYSRNPRIASTFKCMGFMEERGSGIKRMRAMLENSGLRPPKFNYDSGYFVVSFFGQEQPPSIVKISPELLSDLRDKQEKLLRFILRKGRVTSAECAKKLKISNRSVRTNLKKLIDLGIIERKSKGPGTYYVLIAK